MPRLLAVSLVISATLLGAASSHAQLVSDSTVSGTLVSRTAVIPFGETRAEIFDVPSDSHFVVVQACVPLSSGIVIPFPPPQWLLVGSTLGKVQLVSGCTSFEPGVAFSPGEDISCELRSAATSEVHCLVNGVLQRVGRGKGKRRG